MKCTRKKPSKPWNETLRYDEAGCLVVSNIANQDGYIRVSGFPIGKKGLVMLHVLQWTLVNGKVPEGMEVNHKCGNRGCCNIDHLELIDGSLHATLTNSNRVGYIIDKKSDNIVEEIYTKVKYGGFTINKACVEYGIKRSTLSSIMNKRSRTNITDKVDRKFEISLDTIPNI